jgi:hypothetical protein
MIDPAEVRDRAYRWHRRFVFAVVCGVIATLIVLAVVL